jgi:4-amino-4-deoxy-L-arabinose transferase-like glycosyltransferase
VPGDPEAVRPVVRGETYPLFVVGLILAFVALTVCYPKGYVLLYGDAVAHLAIARRILDAHWPGLAQLGGVWLPLPHVLMLPFIMDMRMWQTGLAAAPMSMLSYAASVAGIWRLSRRLMRLRWALVATAFYALNPNLLFLATTAMTEALFLALLVWSVVATMEGISAIRAQDASTAAKRLLLAGVLVLGQVFTRYDGWIIGAVVWCCFAWAMWRSGATEEAWLLRRQLRRAFVVFTVLCMAGPLLWFWYNAHFEGDWLDFMRGPYSAKVIERKTAPPGQHYRGWHNMGWSALFFTRTAQVDAAAWETGFGLMAAALYGLWLSWRRRVEAAVKSRGEAFAWLLWVPLPFYIYSVAYGSVPIFIPQLWPHAYYNARYGMELLPALCVYGALAAERLELWLRAQAAGWAKISARFWQPLAMMLCAANSIAMMYTIPLVLKEGMVNATTRVALERQIATVLEELPPGLPVLMSLTAHVGAVQVAGRSLKSMVSEDDRDAWKAALADPAHHAAFVIAIARDPVDRAVVEHPQGLKELEVLCTTGQPCTRVYESQDWPGLTVPETPPANHPK